MEITFDLVMRVVQIVFLIMLIYYYRSMRANSRKMWASLDGIEKLYIENIKVSKEQNKKIAKFILETESENELRMDIKKMMEPKKEDAHGNDTA